MVWCTRDESITSGIYYKHKSGTTKLAQKEKQDANILDVMKKNNEQAHPKGETLTEEQRVYRVRVVTAFLKAGVPTLAWKCYEQLLYIQNSINTAHFPNVTAIGNRSFRTNVFSYHPFSYHLDTRSYYIVYMFVPHKHTFEIAQI